MRIVALLLLSALSANAAPVELWLTPERARQLKAVSSRPYVTAQRRLADDTAVFTWTNGSRSWETTQAVRRVTGKRAANAWQQKLDAAAREKKALLDDLKALKDRPAKKEIDAIIERHGKK